MTTTPTPTTRSADQELLDRTLQPYRAKEAVYLQDARVGVEAGLVTGRGSFTIREPCYIDDTGHFNAVESLICYNQLMYFSLAVAVRDGLVEELRHWTLDDYWARQLPDVLIYHQQMRYRRPISSGGFEATFRIGHIRSQLDRRMLKLGTTIEFRDPSGGLAEGTVDLALVNVPIP